MLAFEMATVFASGSWTGICGCCHQGDRKTLIKHSRWAGGYSPRPGYRRKIKPHPCCAPVQAPVCSRNEAVREPKIFRMSGATSRCGPTVNCEVTRLTSKKPGEAIKEKAVYSKPATSCVRLVGRREKWIPFSAVVRYLYQPGELEGGRKRASDPI